METKLTQDDKMTIDLALPPFEVQADGLGVIREPDFREWLAHLVGEINSTVWGYEARLVHQGGNDHLEFVWGDEDDPDGPGVPLTIDPASLEMLELQGGDPEMGIYYYVLRGNPAVEVLARHGRIEECLNKTLPVVGGTVRCFGEWPANAHLRGKRTYFVTLFCDEELDGAAADEATPFSEWLTSQYLASDAPYKKPGARPTLPAFDYAE